MNRVPGNTRAIVIGADMSAQAGRMFTGTQCVPSHPRCHSPPHPTATSSPPTRRSTAGRAARRGGRAGVVSWHALEGSARGSGAEASGSAVRLRHRSNSRHVYLDEE